LSFYDEVYEVVREIPEGKVATYGQIAYMLGHPRAARAVGYALHANPLTGVIPCHRVLNREGRLAPAFAFGGEMRQRELLEQENVFVNEENRVPLEKYLWHKN
jgi:methylated-DNA-protein-cysteine methyltransferase-like protein